MSSQFRDFAFKQARTASYVLMALLLVSCKLPKEQEPAKPVIIPAQTTASSVVVSGDTTPYSLKITWAANHEAKVNSTGGGYRVYYYTVSGTSLASSPYVNVPYVSGTLAPTTVTIPNLTRHLPLRYFIRVAAFSALVAPGGATAISVPSFEQSLGVP